MSTTRGRKRERGGVSRPLRGTVRVPGDKSISHRALILGALARGTTTIEGLATGADVAATARAVGALGAAVHLDPEDAKARVEGSGTLVEPTDVIDAGNSGTTARCLLGLCARVTGHSVITGDASLRDRPMLRAVAPLRQMGARISGRSHADRLPLTVEGGELEGISVELDVASAQVKTAILLAGLGAAGRTFVTEPRASRDHTERMLRAAGVEVLTDGAAVGVEGESAPAALDWHVPGDFSSALYLVVAAVLVPGSDLAVAHVGLNPTRTAALDVLREMGADIRVEDLTESGGEPRGTVRARSSELRGVRVDPAVVPQLIDEIPVLAVAATQADGVTEFSGAEELRVKESDRISSMSRGLTELGGHIEERSDGFRVTGGAPLTGGEVESRDDHRVALSLAVAGLIAPDNVRIKGWRCIDTSFPEFLDVLGEATG